MPASTTARGYGHAHQQERKRWSRLVDSGIAVCCRCGGLIPPGTPWTWTTPTTAPATEVQPTATATEPQGLARATAHDAARSH
jgi:hypothetical protein